MKIIHIDNSIFASYLAGFGHTPELLTIEGVETYIFTLGEIQYHIPKSKN